MKILIVEDSNSRQDFLRDILSVYDLIFTTTSVGAIDLLEQKIFDLIFLDMDLDDGLARGLDVARFLRELPNCYSDVIVHSMNISAAAEVKRLHPGAILLPIAQMKLMLHNFGRKGLLERFLEC